MTIPGLWGATSEEFIEQLTKTDSVLGASTAQWCEYTHDLFKI